MSEGVAPTPSSPATRPPPAAPVASPAVTALFGAAIFVAAALLFVVQPMVGRMALPRLGGSPEVWNTSMVFFQLALLAGYGYAHLSAGRLGARGQVALHAAVVLLPLLALPVALPTWAPPEGGWPSGWLIALLGAAVGAPFFALAATSPLLQRWLSATTHQAGADPYFLYVASNAGSLLGLLAYPVVVEPQLPLATQSRLWTLGYGLFVVLTGATAVVALRLGARDAPRGALPGPDGAVRPDTSPAAPEVPRDRPSGGSPLRDRAFWTLSALIPSSLLLAVTHYLTSEVASIPLLWVAPLAIYLVTFMVAFARRPLVGVPAASRMLAIAAVAVALALLGRMRDPAWALIVLHLFVLAAAGLLCHGRLAQARPPPARLTEFYLMVSVGGVLGGAFTALLAPVLFDSVLEYPLAVAAASLLRVPQGEPHEDDGKARRRDLLLPAALLLFLIGMRVVQDPLSAVSVGLFVTLGAAVPALACYFFSPRPLRFALGLAVLLGYAHWVRTDYQGEIVYRERTFFGVYRVARDPEDRFRTLFHGPTVHGAQSRDPALAGEPLGYYHPSGPGGHVMRTLAGRPGEQRIALVGLGTGALAALAAPEDRLTVYEIDPAVVRIAENPEHFSYLATSRAPYDVVLGDGRLALARGEGAYDLIVLDAFSSASVPVHLLTREALEVYLERLAPDGVLLFHISSRHVDLAQVLQALAADLGLAAALRIDLREDADLERGILSSEWVLIARTPEGLLPWVDRRWFPLPPPPPGTPVWTDDFANVLAVYRWN